MNLFEFIIRPHIPTSFFNDYWEKQFLHIERNEPGYFDNILTIEDVDSLLSLQNLIPESIRLVINNEDVSSRLWVDNEKLLNGTIKPTVNPDKIYRFYKGGATIIINAAHKMIPGLGKACMLFEQELKIRVQSNIYITPPNAQGFNRHYDIHDVFVMQIKGPKVWRIYDSAEELPTSFAPFRKEPQLIKQIKVNTGDVLYLPRGIVHEAYTSEVSTIHVNFSCKPKYGFHVLEELAAYAEQSDVFFRKSLANACWNDEECKAYAEELKKKIITLVNDGAVDSILEKQDEDFAARQILSHKSRLVDFIAMEQLGINSIVVRRQGYTYVVKQTNSGSEVSFGNHRLTIPAFIDKGIFLQDMPFRVNDIKGMLTDDGKIALVREFIESGFLRIQDK
jgi:ribosomal protein L16 Arg81 hydroxylase